MLYTPKRQRVPIIRQASNGECGVACLAMILGFYGHQTAISDLLKRIEVAVS